MNAVLQLPDGVRELLGRERIPFADACAFLGFTRQAGHPKAVRYMKRIERERRRAELRGRPLDRRVLIPRRDPTSGEFLEMPCYRASHKLMSRADYVIPMAYPEVGWPR